MSQSTADNSRPRRIVVVCDGPGALEQTTVALGEAGINIVAIDGRLADELGVITLATEDDELARALLDRDSVF